MPKRYTQAAALIEKGKTYPVEEAIELAKKTSTVKFDSSLEVHFKLNVDPKQTDQKVRTQVMLPHGTGKSIKVAAFVGAGKEGEARQAGADLAGGEELVKQIRETGRTDFDVAVAEPAMMKNLATIAKVLGQRGLMPSPKTGNVGEDVGRLVRELKSGRVEVKTDDGGNVHLVIGKASHETKKLLENFQAVKEALHKAKPAAVKRDFLSSVSISSTMGPGIRVQK